MDSEILTTEKEINLIVEVIKNANPLTMGSNLEKFEKKFKHYSNTKYAFAVNTATSALELTAQLINFKKNDEISYEKFSLLTLFRKFFSKKIRSIFS